MTVTTAYSDFEVVQLLNAIHGSDDHRYSSTTDKTVSSVVKVMAKLYPGNNNSTMSVIAVLLIDCEADLAGLMQSDGRACYKQILTACHRLLEHLIGGNYEN